jgi:hypothetical protein
MRRHLMRNTGMKLTKYCTYLLRYTKRTKLNSFTKYSTNPQEHYCNPQKKQGGGRTEKEK